MEKCLYDGKFPGKILVLGQTGCGKTTFFQTLEKPTCLEKFRIFCG